MIVPNAQYGEFDLHIKGGCDKSRGQPDYKLDNYNYKQDDSCRKVIYETIECNEYAVRKYEDVVVADYKKVCVPKTYYKEHSVTVVANRDNCDYSIDTKDVVTQIPNFVKRCTDNNDPKSCGIKTEITEVMTQDIFCDWECTPHNTYQTISVKIPYQKEECYDESIERIQRITFEVTEKQCHVVEKEHKVCADKDMITYFEESVASYTADEPDQKFISYGGTSEL
jgi:ribosomal protein S8